MKLIYISPLRYPSTKAGSLFSMKSCEAFADQGITVELWVPRRINGVKCEDVFAYFGVKNNFKIRQFPVLDMMWLSPKLFNLMSCSFAVSIAVYTSFLNIFNDTQKYVFYSHEQFAIFLLTLINQNTFYELHDFPGTQSIYSAFFKRITGLISTNKWKTGKIIENFNVSKEKIFTVPNAVDVEDFSIGISLDVAREKLNLSTEDVLIGYVGALTTMGMEKGVAVSIDSLQFLPSKYKLYIVGGETKDIEFYKNYAGEKNVTDRVIFMGPVPHKDIPVHMAACDVLIAPYPDTEHYSHYMSPMKIFEYMASKRPMVVTNLPTISEVLVDRKTALFVPSGAPEALSEAIEELYNDTGLATAISEAAYQEVEAKYTWQKRAQKILNFLKQTV